MKEIETVFVTGATGLLGLNTIDVLLSRDYRVLALARSREKALKVLPTHPNLEVIGGDLQNADAWFPELKRAQAVIHTAAYFREYFDKTGNHEADLQALNVDLPVRIVNESIVCGLKRIIMVSSTGVLSGTPDGKARTETSPAEGHIRTNGYQISKVKMERALALLSIPDTTKLVIVRPGWMYGPKDHAPTAVGQLIIDMLKAKTFQMMDGTPFGIVDARDVAYGIVRCLEVENPAAIYHLAGHNMSAYAALETVAKASGRIRLQKVPLTLAYMMSNMLEIASKITGKRNKLPREGIDVIATGLMVDSSKAEKELDVQFRPFEQTAKDTFKFIESNFKV